MVKQSQDLGLGHEQAHEGRVVREAGRIRFTTTVRRPPPGNVWVAL